MTSPSPSSQPPLPARRLALLLLIAAGLLVTWWMRQPAHQLPPRAPIGARAVTDAEAKGFLSLEAGEAAFDAQVWSRARDALRHEDMLHIITAQLEEIGGIFPFLTNLGTGPGWNVSAFRTTELGVAGTQFQLDPAWSYPTGVPSAEFLAQLDQAGWRAERLTFRLLDHTPGTAGSPAISRLVVRGGFVHRSLPSCVQLDAVIRLEWTALISGGDPMTPVRWTPESINAIHRKNTPLFRPVFSVDLSPPTGSSFVDPFIAHDFDGDGVPELCFPGAGKCFRASTQRGELRFEELSAGGIVPPRWPASSILATIVADMTGDGWTDLLAAANDGLWMVVGRATGGFEDFRRVWTPAAPLKHPQVLTVGDVDGDGDLDVFLGQYKLPYQGGQFPTPYYDANDGFDSYLLRNDGGTYTDITMEAGLASKQRRRVYSASLADLNGDGRTDLLVVSDFAGADVFLNEGGTRFSDRTAELGATRHAFGMAHSLGDFDGDGRLDVFLIGMNSPMAGLLDGLNLGRADFPQHSANRAAMTYGNRMLLGTPGGGFRQAGWAGEVAPGGWAWGVAAFDLENDGDLDLYLANGHETLPNPGDHEREFWLHDIYVASSTNNTVADLYFKSVASRRRADRRSYGGWQNNVLFLNLGQNRYIDVGRAVGIGLPEDCRNVLAEDFDGDGRLDLAVTTFELWPQRRQRLLVYRNETPGTGSWIGFRFPQRPGGKSPTNARVTLDTLQGRQTRWITTGDSHRSQASTSVHFGIGTNVTVLAAEVHWSDGSHSALPTAPMNRWHTVGGALISETK
ncbi:MAG: CRTAC1 family protein [Pedosphaera sp.]|nr:CRTAC1 family protein [Pedosphaera sp.]